MRSRPRMPWWREKIDFGVYIQGLFLMFRNPLILLGPLPAALLVEVIRLLQPNPDALGITTLLIAIVRSFGLALAILVADMVWRMGRTSFDQAWEETRRKAGEICYATLGYLMMIYIAGYIGNLLGTMPFFILTSIASVVFIYSIAACTIGGIPGGMSLQASLNMAKSRPINTIILAIASFMPIILLSYIHPYLIQSNGTMAMLVDAVFQSIIIGYAGTIIAKRYADIAFRNF